MENVENGKLAKEALDKLGVSGGALKDLTTKEKLGLAAVLAGTAVGSGVIGYRVGAGKWPGQKGEEGQTSAQQPPEPPKPKLYVVNHNTGKEDPVWISLTPANEAEYLNDKKYTLEEAMDTYKIGERKMVEKIKS